MTPKRIIFQTLEHGYRFTDAEMAWTKVVQTQSCPRLNLQSRVEYEVSTQEKTKQATQTRLDELKN